MESSKIDHPVTDLIQQRRSSRAYAHEHIEQEKINSLFEAARWAPSSMNEQPWTYIYATKSQSEMWNKLFDALNEGNQIWAKDAPLLVLSLARKKFQRNDRTNHTALYDMGAANAFLSLQATELGLNVHQMGGFDGSKVRNDFNVGDEYEIGVIMAIGYPGDPSQLPANLKQRESAPRVRRKLQEFVMNKSF
ncbi:MAG TPA: nitroreductase [Cytophagales bacterium]|nr:nitroreductase [Cytophagales bacterium]HCR54028.1 nitroreductase [Cytophagales bacterium]